MSVKNKITRTKYVLKKKGSNYNILPIIVSDDEVVRKYKLENKGNVCITERLDKIISLLESIEKKCAGGGGRGYSNYGGASYDGVSYKDSLGAGGGGSNGNGG
jgi:hypothetical protein